MTPGIGAARDQNEVIAKRWLIKMVAKKMRNIGLGIFVSFASLVAMVVVLVLKRVRTRSTEFQRLKI